MLHQKYIAKQINVCRGYSGSRESKSTVRSAEFYWYKLQWGMVNTVGAMYTSKQFHICIMKKFRQHFKIAIIAPSDGFTQISIDYTNQESSHKSPKLAGHTKCVRQSGHRKQYGVLYFRGKALAIQFFSVKKSTQCMIGGHGPCPLAMPCQQTLIIAFPNTVNIFVC